MGMIHIQNAAINLTVDNCTFTPYSAFATNNWAIWGVIRGEGGNNAIITNNTFKAGGVCIEGGGTYEDVKVLKNTFSASRYLRLVSQTGYLASINNIYIEDNIMQSLDLTYCSAVISASNIYFLRNKRTNGSASSISGGCAEVKAAIIKE